MYVDHMGTLPLQPMHATGDIYKGAMAVCRWPSSTNQNFL